MTGGHVKKRQCIIVKLLLWYQHCFVKTMARKKKSSCILESRMVYVKKCIFRHNSLKTVLTKKKWQRHFTMGNETLIPTTKIF